MFVVAFQVRFQLFNVWNAYVRALTSIQISDISVEEIHHQKDRASLTMMFNLAQSASNKWKRLKGSEKIAFFIVGRSFKDGILQEEIAA